MTTAKTRSRPGNRPRLVRRKRRTPLEIAAIKAAIVSVLDEGPLPMSVRQVFYRLVSRGTIGKTELEYKNTVVWLLSDMRLAGEIPFDSISDSTRWTRQAETYGGALDALRRTARFYRQELWSSQAVYVEVWVEKEALAGVFYEVTEEYDVPLMVCRGYPSISFLHSSAMTLASRGKPVYVYYFGDRDASGLDISRNVEERLREFAPDSEIHFERVAVTLEQVAEFSLLTRPQKESDSRAKNFTGPCVEVDAIPPRDLRRIVADCITQHIDAEILARVRVTEEAERASLLEVAEIWGRH